MDPLGQDAINALREQFGADTRGLVKALATRLMAIGERPTNMRLRELAGRGSMTTIAGALREWWGELKTDVQGVLDVPGVPDALVEPFQRALGDLWKAAHEAAEAEFKDLSAKAASDVVRAQQEAAAAGVLAEQAQRDLTAARAQATELAGAKAALQERVRQMEVAADQAARERAAQISAANGRIEEAERALIQNKAEARAQIAAIEAARAHEREVLDGQLAFATKQIDEARERVKAVTLDLERERRRGDKIEKTAEAVAESAAEAAKKAQSRQTSLEAQCSVFVKQCDQLREALWTAQRRLAEQAEAHASATQLAADAAQARLAEVTARGDEARAEAAARADAAEQVARAYFEIAAEAIGADVVRKQLRQRLGNKATAGKDEGRGEKGDA